MNYRSIHQIPWWHLFGRFKFNSIRFQWVVFFCAAPFPCTECLIFTVAAPAMHMATWTPFSFFFIFSPNVENADGLSNHVSLCTYASTWKLWRGQRARTSRTKKKWEWNIHSYKFACNDNKKFLQMPRVRVVRFNFYGGIRNLRWDNESESQLKSTHSTVNTYTQIWQDRSPI